jgi:GDPmannose 4,6-dehydratase
LQDKLSLGNLSIERDWGWAPEYVEAMRLMLQQEVPEDFVIATGQTNSLERFVEQAFSAVELDWRKYVVFDPMMRRPTDIAVGKANPSKAKSKLGWQAKYGMREVVVEMVRSLSSKIRFSENK